MSLISAAKVVLGIQQLKTLGPIVTDNANLSMDFKWLGTNIHLQGIRDNDIKEVSSSQLKRMQDIESISHII